MNDKREWTPINVFRVWNDNQNARCVMIFCLRVMLETGQQWRNCQTVTTQRHIDNESSGTLSFHTSTQRRNKGSLFRYTVNVFTHWSFTGDRFFYFHVVYLLFTVPSFILILSYVYFNIFFFPTKVLTTFMTTITSIRPSANIVSV